MARPLRILYPGAWYYLMHTGLNGQLVFKSQSHGATFLQILGDISTRFNVEIHGYCLLPDQYHLLMHTPDGNLSQAMRHLNSVYTQWFNRAEHHDGPLFRGRYKAVLFEMETYLLPLSAYIHRMPEKQGLVDRLTSYRWSSYRAYTSKQQSPHWLCCAKTLSALGQQDAYPDYLALQADKRLHYNGRQMPSVLGSHDFRQVISQRIDSQQQDNMEISQHYPAINIDRVVQAICTIFTVEKNDILFSRRGRGQKNLPRSAAMWLSVQYGGHSLKEVAKAFGLTHYASVASASARAKQAMKTDANVAEKLQQVIVNLATNDYRSDV